MITCCWGTPTLQQPEFHMGIPRLRCPADALSRSSLKLEEAFYVFVPREEWDLRLTSGMKAVDLGACPVAGPISWYAAA